MNIISLNPFVNNFCFLISFFTTIYYWVKIIFFSKKRSKFYGFFGFFILNIILAFQLISRWIESGHFPLSSLYESLLFLCWGITFIYLILENFFKTEFIGVLISPLILCIIAFTEFSLPIELQATKPLVPALQSNWLFMHVSVMMLSYAGLLIGSILSLTYLVMFKYLEQKNPNEISQVGSLIYHSSNTGNFNKLADLLNIFDNLSYRTIGIGFCFLTLGILSGAVWANVSR